MGKIKKNITPAKFNNPFLQEDNNILWKKLEEGAKPISKDDLFKRVKNFKKSEK